MTLQDELLPLLRRVLEQTATGRKVLADGPTEIDGQALKDAAGDREFAEAIFVPMIRGSLEGLYRSAKLIDETLTTAEKYVSPRP